MKFLDNILYVEYDGHKFTLGFLLAFLLACFLIIIFIISSYIIIYELVI